ncbi:hypothetical protein [Pseudonocardia spinosispora]|uniref:hypothetical protein n=1 Tax=Pseudonocardia spinosispora TaxID=103441 RepID=UPI00048E16D8|nr:hypothetical protein [Pseudonocardia spinosispora]
MENTMWLRRVMLGVRLFLALVFIVYGGVKLLGGQYYYGDWVLDKKTVQGPSLVWAFYGYSPFYGRMTGLFELLPALMLLSSRTATLGACALFAVGLNVTVMDFAFGYPEVKYYILGYTLLCVSLMVYDRKRLLLLVRRPAEIRALSPAAGSSPVPTGR